MKKLSTVSIIKTALRHEDIPEKIIGLIEAQYRAFSCRVLHNGALSDPIRVVAEVRQGCFIFPLLFLIVIDEMVVAIDREPNRGFLWQPGDTLLSSYLLVQRRSDTQSKPDDLADRSSVAGLTINVNKTKSLDVNTVNPSSFTVAGQATENVEKP